MLVHKFFVICILIITTANISGCYATKKSSSYQSVKKTKWPAQSLQVGDIIITHKDLRNPISWWGHSAIMVDDTYIGEYPKIFDGYYETDAEFWIQNRDVKTILRYKNFNSIFKNRLMQNIKQYKDRKYKIIQKTDDSAFYCSQYVWYLYWKTAQDLGYDLDIDKNGGYFVMPYDLINDKYFKELQVKY